jgi:hypothetical protein
MRKTATPYMDKFHAWVKRCWRHGVWIGNRHSKCPHPYCYKEGRVETTVPRKAVMDGTLIPIAECAE